MFKVKKYKIGDIVKYNNKWWEIKDINTSSVPIDAEDMIELGLANEEKFYDYILVLLVTPCSKETDICIYLNYIHKENKNMPIKFDDDDWKIDLNLLKKVTLEENVDPVIVDYKVIDNTVVIFTFSDGTTEKTVCNREFDEFDLNKAIELAICKKKFGGTKAYHKAINKAMKQIENIDAKKQAEIEEQERIAHKKAKYAERQAKRKAKKRQEQIDIQTEAFYQAMIKYDDAMAATDLYTEYAPDKNVENSSDSALESTETE